MKKLLTNHEKTSLGRLWSRSSWWDWLLATYHKLVSCRPSQLGLIAGKVCPSRPSQLGLITCTCQCIMYMFSRLISLSCHGLIMATWIRTSSLLGLASRANHLYTLMDHVLYVQGLVSSRPYYRIDSSHNYQRLRGSCVLLLCIHVLKIYIMLVYYLIM